ncbi:MAG: transporter substrate-binding domain-containing protein [Kordiimonadaceae bacterium]|nr:transporter substrate-binding domain-containing protein [Kordiimonadaceae bacterium]
MLQSFATSTAFPGNFGRIATFYLFIIAASLGCGHPTQADEPQVGNTQTKEVEDAPLHVGLSDTFGLQQEWNAILKEAGIKVQHKEISHVRRRRMFVEGFLQIDCCMPPEWRNTPEEQAVQLFSDIFFTSEEVYVFGKGKTVPINAPEDLRNLRVAVIQGFTYNNSEHFGSTLPSINITNLFNLIEKGRAHVGIVSKADYTQQMTLHPRDLEMGGVNAVEDFRIRLHKSKAHLLPRLNAAIANLMAQGKLGHPLTASHAATSSKTSRN